MNDFKALAFLLALLVQSPASRNPFHKLKVLKQGRKTGDHYVRPQSWLK
jgi:hypothetical protein